MRNIFIGICLGITLSCASKYIPITLTERILIVNPDKPALSFPHCEKDKFMSDECKDFKVDDYDLTDALVRRDLKDFVCLHISKLNI